MRNVLSAILVIAITATLQTPCRSETPCLDDMKNFKVIFMYYYKEIVDNHKQNQNLLVGTDTINTIMHLHAAQEAYSNIINISTITPLIANYDNRHKTNIVGSISCNLFELGTLYSSEVHTFITLAAKSKHTPFANIIINLLSYCHANNIDQLTQPRTRRSKPECNDSNDRYLSLVNHHASVLSGNDQNSIQPQKTLLKAIDSIHVAAIAHRYHTMLRTLLAVITNQKNTADDGQDLITSIIELCGNELAQIASTVDTLDKLSMESSDNSIKNSARILADATWANYTHLESAVIDAARKANLPLHNYDFFTRSSRTPHNKQYPQ